MWRSGLLSWLVILHPINIPVYWIILHIFSFSSKNVASSVVKFVHNEVGSLDFEASKWLRSIIISSTSISHFLILESSRLRGRRRWQERSLHYRGSGLARKIRGSRHVASVGHQAVHTSRSRIDFCQCGGNHGAPVTSPYTLLSTGRSHCSEKFHYSHGEIFCWYDRYFCLHFSELPLNSRFKRSINLISWLWKSWVVLCAVNSSTPYCFMENVYLIFYYLNYISVDGFVFFQTNLFHWWPTDKSSPTRLCIWASQLRTCPYWQLTPSSICFSSRAIFTKP